MTHNFWCEDGILNGLYYGEDDECAEHYHPETLARIGSFDDSQQDGRNEADEL